MANDTNRHENSEYLLGSLMDDSDDMLEDSKGSSDELFATEEKAMQEIEAIRGDVKDKEAGGEESERKQLEEFLLQSLIKLDGVTTWDSERVKAARRDAIVYIQGCLKQLDSKDAEMGHTRTDGLQN